MIISMRMSFIIQKTEVHYKVIIFPEINPEIMLFPLCLVKTKKAENQVYLKLTPAEFL